MKTLLIVPRYNLTNKKDYTYFFPIGLASIYTVVKNKGYDIDCINLNHSEGLIKDLVNSQLDKANYDVILTGHVGIGYNIIEKIIEAARAHKSNPKIILGGAIITSEPELMLESLKPDFAVIGEGEITVIELLKCIETKGNPKEVDGMCYLDDLGNKIFTKPRKPIEDLDSLPFPDYESLGFNEYLDKGELDRLFYYFDKPRTYSILGSRGCPFQCTFCYHCLGSQYRMRSVNNMIEEISYAIEKYNLNSIWLEDDLFSSNKVRLFDFCDRLKTLTKDLPEFKWFCNLRVDMIDREIMFKLKESGCLVVAFGFESYSPIVLKSMKKYITPEQIDKAIKMTEEAGIILNANFIFGDIAETKETAKETLDYWKENCKGQVTLFFVQPYPGSEIFKRCIEKGIIKDKLDYIKNHMNYFSYLNFTDNMSDEEIEQLNKDILEARRKYRKYVMPELKKNNERYELKIKCPFCNSDMDYNVCLKNKSFYAIEVACRDCKKRFFIVSRLYKFVVNHYEGLNFFKENYLSMKNKILKKRM